ncbi:helix-turn-helix transcriptional regulator [Nocardioides sp.]|uniref:response regulator transcription factor n=1 Tax=Nocardioides sp. TaxID=35761 RepID=UPI002C0C6B80|nr:helix-turn-helix transcriptional regulator [Nocardioides sp.]HXH79274.1 helix-turn-helix transcriptional regulator [Nocardioides sp.]
MPQLKVDRIFNGAKTWRAISSNAATGAGRVPVTDGLGDSDSSHARIRAGLLGLDDRAVTWSVVRGAAASGHSVGFTSAPRVARPAGWVAYDEGLTRRESEVLGLIVSAASNREVGNLLCLSPNSVKSYIRSIYRKIGVSSRSQAVLWGLEQGFGVEHS